MKGLGYSNAFFGNSDNASDASNLTFDQKAMTRGKSTNFQGFGFKLPIKEDKKDTFIDRKISRYNSMSGKDDIKPKSNTPLAN